MRPKLVIARDAAPAAADGLALGALQALFRWWPTAPHPIHPSAPGGAS